MAGIRSLPTFQIYRRGTKVAEKLGADPNLEQWLQEHDNAMPESFTGTGRTLGGEAHCNSAWLGVTRILEKQKTPVARALHLKAMCALDQAKHRAEAHGSWS